MCLYHQPGSLSSSAKCREAKKTRSKNDDDGDNDDDNNKNTSAAVGVGSWLGYGQAGKKGQKVFYSQYNALQG